MRNGETGMRGQVGIIDDVIRYGHDNLSKAKRKPQVSDHAINRHILY